MSVPVSEYVPDFRPTHVVPRSGLDAWEAPDPGLPTTPLDAFLPVRLEERAGDWGRILCSNGWTAWVDARLLVTVPDDPPAAGGPLTRTADPRPLIARAEDALGRYRRAAEALGAGRLDGENFRLRTRGLRVGMVVDGESVWLYDAEHERWVYCDGVGLSTYAAGSSPSVAAAAVPGAGAGAAAGERAPGAGRTPGKGAAGAEGHPGLPPVHEPTQVVAQIDSVPVSAAPPAPTQVVPRADDHAAEPPEAPPTQEVPRAEPPAAPAPPPTQVVKSPPGTAGED